MRKSGLLLASVALTLLLASGVAWAATIQCPEDEYSRCVGTGGPDTMYGTDDDGYGDWIEGLEGNDRAREYGGGLFGGRGEDLVRGGYGQDDLSGGRGSDRLYSRLSAPYSSSKKASRSSSTPTSALGLLPVTP